MPPEQRNNRPSFTFDDAMRFASEEVVKMYHERPYDLTEPTRDRIQKQLAGISTVESGRTPRYLDATDPEAGIKIDTPSSNNVLRNLINKAMGK